MGEFIQSKMFGSPHFGKAVNTGEPGLTAQLDVHPTGDQATGSIPARLGNIGHEIFSTVILSLLLIQEGQLLVSGETVSTDTS